MIDRCWLALGLALACVAGVAAADPQTDEAHRQRRMSSLRQDAAREDQAAADHRLARRQDVAAAARCGGGAAECVVAMAQSTPVSIAEAAGAQLARLGLARTPTDDPGVSWAGPGGWARTFASKTRSGATLVIRLTPAPSPEPRP